MEKCTDRICGFCGAAFTVTKTQQRQVYEKWPKNCSRTCAKRAQHVKNHGDKRIDKSCPICSTIFTVTPYNIDKTFCSAKCSAIERFGMPSERIKKNNERLLSILRDKKYMRYMRKIAYSIGRKYGVDAEDILQDFFLHLASGHNSTIENTAMEIVRLEYNRGFTKTRFCKNAAVDLENFKHLQDHRSMNDLDIFEYLLDLRKILTDDEMKIVHMLILGHGKVEIEKMYILPKRQAWNFFKKHGI